MKLSDYVKNLTKILESNPLLKDVEVVVASKATGSQILVDYSTIEFNPELGKFDGDMFETCEDVDINAICVN